MGSGLLPFLVSVFFLGGLFGVTTSLIKFLDGGTPAEYGVLGIGGGFFLLSSAIVILIRRRAQAS